MADSEQKRTCQWSHHKPKQMPLFSVVFNLTMIKYLVLRCFAWLTLMLLAIGHDRLSHRHLHCFLFFWSWFVIREVFKFSSIILMTLRQTLCFVLRFMLILSTDPRRC